MADDASYAADDTAADATRGGPPAPPRSLADLPPDLLERVLTGLGAPDLASANATSRLFRSAPPGGHSALEAALRERARARGHAPPAALPAHARTWTEELLAREAVLLLARAHADVVAAGTAAQRPFSAFVDAEGGLHTCGEEARTVAPMEVAAAQPRPVIGHPHGRTLRLPTRVASLGAVRVCAVAAGCAHLLALSDAGAVYGCGGNGGGQLGLGDLEARAELVRVDGLATELIVCIAAGAAHSLALTAAGCAYSWGYNYFGQLGHGDKKDRLEPACIKALDGVARVGGMAAGGEHTLLLSIGGEVYSCGEGWKRALGHGDQRDQHTPRRIEALAGVRAVHVSVGGAHSLVVDVAGGVHACGFGDVGASGYDDCCMHRTPARVGALAGVRAVRACAGSFASAVLGADGSAHTFGANTHGVLGQGPAARADGPCGPARVALPAGARVLGVSLGGAHALFVTAPDGAAHACGERTAALGLGVALAPPGPAREAPRTAVNVPARVDGLAPLALSITTYAAPAEAPRLVRALQGGATRWNSPS